MLRLLRKLAKLRKVVQNMACSGALKAEFAVLEKKIVDESQNVKISRITPFF